MIQFNNIYIAAYTMILDIQESMPVLMIVWQRGLMEPKFIGSTLSVEYSRNLVLDAIVIWNNSIGKVLI